MQKIVRAYASECLIRSRILARHDMDTVTSNTHVPPSTNKNAESSSNEIDLNKVYEDLLYACRSGDAESVDTLTLVPNLDINKVDEWDYSPLILASLCGHLEIVKILLSRGAVCDRDTFVGARCVYGALTDEIRELLLSHDFTISVDNSQPFLAHVSSLYATLHSSLSAKDIVVEVSGGKQPNAVKFMLNRFLLASRSKYFASKLFQGGSWSTEPVIVVPECSDPTIFEAIVDYIYLRTDQVPLESPLEQLVNLAEKLELAQLLEAFQLAPTGARERAKFRQKALILIADNAREEMKTFMIDHIFHNLQEVKLDEEVSFEDIDAEALLADDLRGKLLLSSAIPDVVLSSIDLDTDSVVYYPVHRAMLSRSTYYATMFRSEMFHSKSASPIVPGACGVTNRPLLGIEHLPVLQPAMSTTSRKVTELVLQYLYYDVLIDIPSHLCMELLFAAEELCIDRLKSICALSLAASVNFTKSAFEKLRKDSGATAFEWLEVSWQTRCYRLEQHMTKLIAHNLGYIYGQELMKEDLLGSIQKSAMRIKERQDTDTIELVDDIRYYLAKKHGVYDNFTGLDGISFDGCGGEDLKSYAFDRDIMLVDRFLHELALDA